MKSPIVELAQVVSDDSEKRVFRDNSSGQSREYTSRTISGITRFGSLCTISVPERVSPAIQVEVGSPASIPASRIEVVRGIWQCVASIQ